MKSMKHKQQSPLPSPLRSGKKARARGRGMGLLALSGALAGLIGCGGGGSPTTGGTPTPTPTPTIPPPPGGSRSVLVALAPGADRAAIERELGVTLEDGGTGGLFRVRLRDEDDEDEITGRISRDSRVSGTEKNRFLRSPEVHGSPIHQAFDIRLSASGGSDTGFENQGAWEQVRLSAAQAVTRGAGITVAVLDTGVESNHPDLKDHLLPGYDVLAPETPPDDASDGTLNNVVGHGTMVSGLIAKIAPDAKILPVRVLNGDGAGSTLDVLQGMHWAIDHGANVINLSLGSPEASRFLKEAIDDARERGVVVVAAAGNDGVARVDFPALESSVICTTAVNGDNRRATFANYGSPVDLVAPGTGIRSTFGKTGYASWSGTSFAAPFVTGAAALVRSANPTLRADKVIEFLEKTARPVDSQNPEVAGKLGEGLLDIGEAVRRR